MKRALGWLLLLLTLVLAGCGKPPVYHEQGYVFGTLVDVTVFGVNETEARPAVAPVLQELQRLHHRYHAWEPSELSGLNEVFAQGGSKALSPELDQMLREATRLSEQSGGLFNPAIGGLIETWGFQASTFKPILPDPARVQTLLAAKPQMSDIVIEQGSARSLNPAVKLDLGGYAKGYALDRSAELLHARGIHNALINIGGNIMALGLHGDRAWRVGIQHPRRSGTLASLELHDGEAIGTSGDYQRFFELDGKRYCHIIDPRTGAPAQGVQAVTIITRGEQAGVRSDVASKPLFLSGTAGWRAAARQMQIEEALLVDDSGRLYVTAALNKRLKYKDKTLHPEVLP